MIKRRKVVLDFTVKTDAKGKVLNPEVLSKTTQTEKDSVDINRIMKNHEQNGGLIGDPFRKSLNEQVQNGFVDFTKFGDYREIKSRAAVAEQSFMLLPPDVRSRFNNDPQELFQFLADSKNDKEAVKLGLKSEDVLKTALADDGVTRITPEARKILDDEKAAKAAKQAAGGPAAGASGTGTGS